MFCQSHRSDIGETRCHNRDNDAGKQSNLAMDHVRADKLSDACTEKGTNHFRDSAAEQEGEGCTSECGSQAEHPGLIVAGFLLKLIEHFVVFVDAGGLAGFFEAVDHFFEIVQLVGVDSGGTQGIGLCTGIAVVKTGNLQSEKTNVCSTGNAKGTGHHIDGTSDTPGTGAYGQG